MQHRQNYEAVRQAEVALIGALLINPTIQGAVRARVTPEMFLDSKFTDDLHARLYRACLASQPCNQITVAQKLHEWDKLGVKDISYMSFCISECPCSLDAVSYANCVAYYAAQRGVTQKTVYKGLRVGNA